MHDRRAAEPSKELVDSVSRDEQGVLFEEHVKNFFENS